jgi:hypothetical protein
VLAVNALFDRARAERFAQLMDEAGGRRRHHIHSKLDDELTELVAAAQMVRELPIHAEARPIFKRDLRAMLIAAAERDGIGVTSVTAERDNRVNRPRARSAIAIGIAAGTLALSGVSVASSEALPGDALYGMKRSTKRAQLALAGTDLIRGKIYLDFARMHLQEANAARHDEDGFVVAMTAMDVETQQGVKMLVGTALNHHDTSALDAIEGFLASQREAVAQMLRLGEFPAPEKVTESLALLNLVKDRVTAARSALVCGAKASGSDALGPIVSCPAPVTGRQSGTAQPDSANESGRPARKPAKAG